MVFFGIPICEKIVRQSEWKEKKGNRENNESLREGRGREEGEGGTKSEREREKKNWEGGWEEGSKESRGKEEMRGGKEGGGRKGGGFL